MLAVAHKRILAVVFLAASIAWGAPPVKAQSVDDPLVALDALIDEIERTFLPRDDGFPPLPENACTMDFNGLRDGYVEIVEGHRALTSEVNRAVTLHQQATERVRAGEGCNERVLDIQRSAIALLEPLPLDDELAHASLIADCAPRLQEQAEAEIATTTNQARRRILQDRIEMTRIVRGQSLRVAGEIAFMRDRRSRLVGELEENIAACSD